MAVKRCELCRAEAAVYCEPDAAFLCWPCDAAVHGANFLVARHVRRVACAACRSVGSGIFVTGGARAGPVEEVCPSCDPNPMPSPSSSASMSSCISTAGPTAAPLPRSKAASRAAAPLRRPRTEAGRGVEGVLAGWSRQMGLRSGRRCAAEAAHVLGACRREIAALPPRVALAAALWAAVKNQEASGARLWCEAALLRRLEAFSGVPTRVLVVAASRIARVARSASAEKAEGWAESS